MGIWCLAANFFSPASRAGRGPSPILLLKCQQRWHLLTRMVGVHDNLPGENAMSTVWPFVTKHASLVAGTLHCFDRVIFKGHLAMASSQELERFVDYVLKVRR